MSEQNTGAPEACPVCGGHIEQQRIDAGNVGPTREWIPGGWSCVNDLDERHRTAAAGR